MLKDIAAVALVLSLSLAGAASAQQNLTLPHLRWQTVETKHFVIHYPLEAAEWTLDLAQRIESVRDAVSALVGSSPAQRVTVIVADPNNVSNGFALPFLDKPLIFLWPTPPDPSSGIGESRSWSEILSVHEFAHIAHLTRPSRNPLQRFVWGLSPAELGPLAVKSPRWLIEGYATYVEGRVTGTGRPHSALRPAVLRQWALEGKLPTYAQLNDDSRFYGGAMPYLAGSAFLEWLVDKKGDSSLVYLWRRMSARTNRSFGEAFAGVFGGLPDDLYGRFTAELTGRALDLARVLGDGAVRGADSTSRVLQKLEWRTGSPAISHDGSLLSLVIDARLDPSRVVVWKTADEPEDSSVIKERERERRLDPEDVPAVEWRPRPKRAIATLYPSGGAPYAEPRFLPDGKRILLSRYTGRGDGALRLDLFIWDFEAGRVRRITHGAGIQHADPSPDGRFAVADRCVGGICDVVRVDLASGDITRLAAGAPRLVYYRPRYSPNGREIVVSVQRHGRWHIALLHADGGAPRLIGPADDANRYDVTFMPDGKSLVLVSDASGIPNLELLDLATGETRTLTKVTSATLAPEPSPRDGSVYYLRLHGKGLDLDRITPDSVPRRPSVATSPRYTPAARIPVVSVDTFAHNQVSAPRGYGLGPRWFRVLPSMTIAAEGKYFGALIGSLDPIGRLSWLLQGVYGDRGTWRGAALSAAWRAQRPTLSGEFFYAEDHPSRQHGGVAPSAALDVNYAGAALYTQLDRYFATWVHRYRLGVSLGQVDGPTSEREGRHLAFAELKGRYVQTPSVWRFDESISVLGSSGVTAGEWWNRALITARFSVRWHQSGLDLEGGVGRVDRSDIPLEQFVLGGTDSPLFDPALLSQRVAMPALPLGVGGGRNVAFYRISLPGAGPRPYYWAATAGDDLGRWRRVIGLETELRTEGIWPARLPGARLLAGLGYSLTDPFRRRARAYLSITYRP